MTPDPRGSAAPRFADATPPCDVCVTDDGPGVVLALCRTCQSTVARDSAFRWDYLRVVVEQHIRTEALRPL